MSECLQQPASISPSSDLSLSLPQTESYVKSAKKTQCSKEITYERKTIFQISDFSKRCHDYLDACHILPFILLFMSSITDENTLVANGYSFLPEEVLPRVYSYIIKSGGQILKAYGVSIGVTVVGTLLNVLLSALMAYPLSVKNLPGRNVMMFFCVLYPCCSTAVSFHLTLCGQVPSISKIRFCTAASKLPAFCMECYDDSNLFYHKHSGWIIRGGRD